MAMASTVRKMLTQSSVRHSNVLGPVCRFMSLPPELRNYIYMLLLCEHPWVVRLTSRWTKFKGPPLLRSTDEISREAEPFYWSTATIHFLLTRKVKGFKWLISSLDDWKLQLLLRNPCVFVHTSALNWRCRASRLFRAPPDDAFRTIYFVPITGRWWFIPHNLTEREMIQRCEKYYPYTLSVVAAEYLGETADSVVMEPVAPSERTPVENRVMKALGRRTNTDYT